MIWPKEELLAWCSPLKQAMKFQRCWVFVGQGVDAEVAGVHGEGAG